VGAEKEKRAKKEEESTTVADAFIDACGNGPEKGGERN